MNDVITGGLLALAGVGVGQVVTVCTNWLQREETRNSVYRGKCEEMGTMLMEGSQWFNKLTLCYSFDDLKKNPPPPEHTKLTIFAKLYFPSVENHAIDYCNLVIEYYHYLLDCVSPLEGASPISVPARAVGLDNKKYHEWDNRITTAKNNLLEALCQQVKEHL